MEDRVTIINDLPAPAATKGAIETELTQTLKPFPGPWTVRLRPVDLWQGDGGWSIEVSRPGHVWTLRVNGAQQDPPLLARCIVDNVQPQRFGPRAE
jgi:hypothetical protein